MTLNERTINELARLYDERRRLQKAREFVPKSSVVEKVATAFACGGGYNTGILEAVGGVENFRSFLVRVLDEEISRIQRDLDVKIAQLGGEI